MVINAKGKTKISIVNIVNEVYTLTSELIMFIPSLKPSVTTPENGSSCH